MAFEEYRLSKTIKAHTNAIRDMYTYQDANGSPKLVTVSRDCEAKIFSIVDGTIAERADLTFSNSVPMSSVTVLPRPNQVPLLFFGCSNGAIFVHLAGETTPLNVLTFHSQNVCAVRIEPKSKLLASGSWDNTAIVYDIENDKIRFRILTHTQAVQDVVFLNPALANGRDCLLTASSDKTIVLWDISSDSANSTIAPVQLRAYHGHEDCVRGLLLDSFDRFYSVSNDMMIRCWCLTSGETLRTLIGHEHFVYRIAPLRAGLFMTCGEDTTVRLWSSQANGEQEPLRQTIKLPVVSIWCMTAFGDRDFAAAGSDGRIYVLSNDPSKAMPADQMMTVQELVAKQNAIPFADVAHLKLYEQSSLDAMPASSVGELRLIRSLEDDSVMVYEAEKNDNPAVCRWKPVGVVRDYEHRDQYDSFGRVFFNGEYYDEVIPVTLHGLKFRVAYNHSIDPWLVANDFVAFHHLEKSDLEPILRAIVTTAKYRVPNRTESDAFSDRCEFPLVDMTLFASPPNWDKFTVKFLEFNQALDDGDRLKLDDETFATLSAEFGEPSRNAAKFLDCYRKLFEWPSNCRFLVFDLFRLHLTNRYFASYFLHNSVAANRDAAILDTILAATNDQTSLATQLTALRCLTNIFSTIHGAQHMIERFDYVQRSIVPWSALIANRNVHLAYASVWFNYSVTLVGDARRRESPNEGGKLDALMGSVADSDNRTEFSESIAKILHTFGNLLVAGGPQWAEQELARNFRVIATSTYAERFPDAYEVKRALINIKKI